MTPSQLLRALVPLLGLTCACAAAARVAPSTGAGSDEARVEAPPSRRALGPRRGDLDNVGWA